MFCNSGISSINLPKELEKIGEWAFRECNNLKQISLPENIEEIPSGCFYKSGLEEIVVPRKVKKIGGYYFFGGAFQGCENLQNIIFDQGSELTEIGDRAFLECRNLRSICLPYKL